MFSMQRHDRDQQSKMEKDRFLEKSYHYKELKRLHNLMQTEEDKKYTSSWLDAIEKAEDLYRLSYATRDLDPALTDSLFVYRLGRNKWNALLFLAGYASNRINFNYHLLHLRESIESYQNTMRHGSC